MKQEGVRDLIPEVYCDVFPLCAKVIGYTKDGTKYILRMDSGKELLAALKEKILRGLPKRVNKIEYETDYHQGVEDASYRRGFNHSLLETKKAIEKMFGEGKNGLER